MLAVSPFRDENHHHQHHHHQQGGEVSTTSSSLESNYAIDTQELPDFADANLLIDSIDFDDLFAGIDDGDMLPDLEMDPEILAEFSVSSPGRGGNNQESSERTMMTMDASVSAENKIGNNRKEEEDKVSASASASASGSGSGSSLSKEEEIVSKRAEPVKTSAKDHGDKLGSSRSSSHSKINNHGKRKVKVDWTPELHRRFVQAVEQLGVDKAVPSRILELMGIDCLTRHNIASHLQKYRSHRKHLLAREAEAASWSQRRHMYGGAAAGGGKRDMNHWIAPPTIGFPPMTPPPPPPMHPHLQPRFRPLHVWGHPTMDQCLMHMWHKSSPPPPPAQAHSVPVLPSWAGQPAARPPPPHWHQQQVPNGLATPGTPCFPQPLATTRFAAPPVPGIPPHHPAMYKVEPQPGVGVLTAQSGPHLLIDSLPSKESIDAAIGDVLSKPWLPLPLGLKAPSVDGVIGELQRQGVSKIPPSSA